MSTATDFDKTEEMSGDASHCRVGAALQAERLKRGEDLETISETLRIRVAHLRALEEGWWEELPAEAYVVGFLKSYARHLGMDEDAVAHSYRAAGHQNATPSRLLFPEPIDDSRVPKAPLVMLSAFLALVGYGLWYVTAGAQFVPVEATDRVPPHLAAFAEDSAPAQAVEETETQRLAMAEAPAPNAAPASPASGLTAVSVTATSRIAPVVMPSRGLRKQVTVADRGWSVPEELSRLAGGPSLIRSAHAGRDSGDPDGRVVLQATADTWIQIRGADETVLHEGLLKTGERYRAPNAAGVTLTTSNIGALEIRVDGEPVELLGATGTVKEDLPLSPEQLAGSVHAEIALD